MNYPFVNRDEKRDKKRIVRFLVGSAIGAFILGNVLAAAITINDGTTVNFGQGAAGMTACASGITYSVVSDFGTSGFNMTSMLVTVTDQPRLDAAGSPSLAGGTGPTVGACDDKVMTVYAYAGAPGSTSVIGTMWIKLIVSGVQAETYTMTPATDTQPAPSPGVAPATGQYASTAITPESLGGLAFEITDQE